MAITIESHNNFPKANDFHIWWGVNHHHQRCLQIALSVVCMGCAGKEVLWSDLDKTASLLYQPAQGVGGGVALQPRAQEWAYTTCPGFRVYRDTRSRGVNLQFSVKCALKNWWIWRLVSLSTYTLDPSTCFGSEELLIRVGLIELEYNTSELCAVECIRAREVGG